MDQLSESARKDLQSFMEQETAKAQMQTAIHEFSSRCWEKCITHPKPLSSAETSCLQNCVGRFIDTSSFIVKRLQHNTQQ